MIGGMISFRDAGCREITLTIYLLCSVYFVMFLYFELREDML